MNIVVLTPARLLADGLKAGLNSREGIQAIAVVDNLSALWETLASAQIDLVLIDVTQEVDWDEMGKLAADFPQVVLWALGTEQQLHNLKRQGLSIFSGYISRSASIAALYQAITEPAEEHSANSPDSVPKSSEFSLVRFIRQINPFRRKKLDNKKRVKRL